VASNSNYGVGSAGNPQRGYSMMLVEGFVRGLLSEPGNSNLGAIVSAWAGAVPYARHNLVYRWCLFCWNLLGETAMPVWVPLASGVAEGEKSEVRRVKGGATVVRGVLFLPEARGEKREARSDLLDISGRKVMVLRSGPNDVSGLAPGVYYIASGPNSGRTQKIVKTGRE
jgi:hypothetical protein